MSTTAARASDTEKITINLGLIDLGQIDLLVQEGFYSNRTDLIRTAIRNHLATHAEAVRQAVTRKTLVLGLVEFTRADLEGVKKSAKRLRIQVLGLARIAPDVPVALALATIESVSVLGAFHASPAVKAALADRDRGHAVPARHRGIRIPVQLQIIVVVQVDSPRSDDASGGVQLFHRRRLDASADHGDLSVLDRHIAPIGRYPSRPIHNRAVPDDQVVFGHFVLLLSA